jgi:tRNA A37 threonylcarbamoyladenosine dehydratase
MEPKRVVLVGAGGIGTWLAEGVVRLLEWKYPGSALIIVDGDSYEQRNLERQSFTQVGNKASVKALELTKQFNVVMVCGTANDSVKLPPPEMDNELVIYNLSLVVRFHLSNTVNNFLTSNGNNSDGSHFKSILVCILAVIDLLS